MKNPVRVELRGGLGNQLFQYYAGAYLATKFDSELEFDLTHLHYSHEPHVVNSIRPGESIFELLNLPGKQLIRSRNSHSAEKVTRKIMGKTKYFDTRLLAPKIFSKTYESKTIGFDPTLGERYFSRIGGYFQTYKYFKHVTDLDPRYQPVIGKTSSWYTEELKYISNEQPVIIHLRKHYPWLEGKFTQCGPEYYAKALETLNEVSGVSKILVFGTNEIDIQSYIPGKFLKLCRFNDKPKHSPDLESLILMSKSPALVTANSTFSWWAGNFSMSNQIVIAPKKIYINQPNPIDYYPPNWITL